MSFTLGNLRLPKAAGVFSLRYAPFTGTASGAGQVK
ncbi:MAG: hypothetical protein QOJ33_2255 [Chloroflexota bacterium]|nr:hypothetical protein [Chloroflexota bacterium]